MPSIDSNKFVQKSVLMEQNTVGVEINRLLCHPERQRRMTQMDDSLPSHELIVQYVGMNVLAVVRFIDHSSTL